MQAEVHMPQWLQWMLSAVGGAFIAFVGFRTRIHVLEGKVKDNATKIELGAAALVDAERRVEQRVQEAEERIERQLEEINRRQGITLQLVADIANKVGVEKRFSDALVRFLAEGRQRVD